MLKKDLISFFELPEFYLEIIAQGFPVERLHEQIRQYFDISCTDLIDLIETEFTTGEINTFLSKTLQYRKTLLSHKINVRSPEIILEIPMNSLLNTLLGKKIILLNDRNIEIFRILAYNAERNGVTLRELEDQIILFRYGNPHDIVEEGICEDKLDEGLLAPEERVVVEEENWLRIFKSLQIHVDKEIHEDLKSLLLNKKIDQPINFNLPANSLIHFYRELHNEQIILSTKENTKKFILRNFCFYDKSKKHYKSTSLGNIVNYLTREYPPSNVAQKIVLLLKC